MPFLLALGSDGVRKSFRLIKRVTSVGRHPDSDVRLEDPSVPEHAFTVLREGESWRAGAVDGPFSVDGKRKDAAVLTDGLCLRVGHTELTFSEAADVAHPAQPADAPAILRRLIRFSATLLKSRDADALLEILLDEAVALTGADRGLVLVLQEGELVVRAARNVSRETLADARHGLSDTVLGKVLRSGEPLLVQNALADPEFSASASVVDLQLSSILCVPLGDAVPPFGLLYLGTDRFRGGFDAQALDLLTIFAAQASLLLQNALLLDELRLDVRELRDQLQQHRYGELVGACEGMRDVYRRVDKVAPTDITGADGGGERHRQGAHRPGHPQAQRRADRPFVAINCGALPEALLEAELFGHVKGAFTGAVADRRAASRPPRAGRSSWTRSARCRPSLQVKLLRVLQEQQVRAGRQPSRVKVDVRVVAATNRDLLERSRPATSGRTSTTASTRWRYALPPCAERGDDVLVLARYFLGIFASEYRSRARGFSPAALAALRKYAWPGNVRELRNRIQRAVVLAERRRCGPRTWSSAPTTRARCCRWPVPARSFSGATSSRFSSATAATAPAPPRELGVDPRTVFRFLEKREAERQGGPAGPDEEPA